MIPKRKRRQYAQILLVELTIECSFHFKWSCNKKKQQKTRTKSKEKWNWKWSEAAAFSRTLYELNVAIKVRRDRQQLSARKSNVFHIYQLNGSRTLKCQNVMGKRKIKVNSREPSLLLYFTVCAHTKHSFAPTTKLYFSFQRNRWPFYCNWICTIRLQQWANCRTIEKKWQASEKKRKVM